MNPSVSLVRFNRQPSPRELRQFAACALAFAAVAGGLAWRRDAREVAAAAWALGAGVALAGWWRPPVLRPLWLVALALAWPVGWVVSHLVLAGIYFLVLTPVGWLLRLAGHDPLDQRGAPARPTYWTPRGPPRPRADYFRLH